MSEESIRRGLEQVARGEIRQRDDLLDPTLTDFLLARIAEDEAIAREAAPGPWRYEVAPELQSNGYRYGVVMSDPKDLDTGSTLYVEVADGYTTDPPMISGQAFNPSMLRPEDGEHIAHHDPARVLAECEAKRRIVGIVGRLGGHYEPNAGRIAPDILKWLALTDAAHPDYREEWKP